MIIVVLNLHDLAEFVMQNQCMPAVTERTLSLQLKALEEDGLIKRMVYTSKQPLKVEYSLTDFGKTAIPLVQSIAKWGDLVAKNYAK